MSPGHPVPRPANPRVPFLEHRPHAIVTRKPPDPIETQMMELFAWRLNRDDKPLGKSELIAAVGDPDLLPATVGDRIDGEVLRAIGPRGAIEGRIARARK
jgi:hypothetical protein